MGSRSHIDLAYIAGFLDGDGSLMLQIKKRKDGNKRRFMCTVCFYQDTRHEKPLFWIRDIFDVGYISRRNDGMTELRINGFKRVKEIMAQLLPFIRFKKDQAIALHEASVLLSRKTIRNFSTDEIHTLIDCIIKIQSANYVARKKRTKDELMKIFDLTP